MAEGVTLGSADGPSSCGNMDLCGKEEREGFVGVYVLQ